MFGIFGVGPFPGTVNPVRPGVYFTTPFENAIGGGYCRWNGKSWEDYGRWGGNYSKGTQPWWWMGLTEEASRSPKFVKFP